jgi:hypothetical protein
MNVVHLISIVVLSFSLYSTAVFALPFEFGGKTGYESFNWREFNQNGQQTVEEKGTHMTLSGFLHSKPDVEDSSHFIYGAEMKIYGGATDYQDNNPANANQDYQTDWTGVSLEGEGGLRVGSLPLALDFIGKLGFDVLFRTMDGALDTSTRDVQAEQEEYDVLNLRLGTGPTWRAGNWFGQVRLGVKYPLAASVIIPDKKSNYDNNSNGQLEVPLDGRITPFFTFGNKFRITDRILLKIDAYYDAYKFKRSGTKITDTDNNQKANVTIPESKLTNYGIQAGVSIDF